MNIQKKYKHINISTLLKITFLLVLFVSCARRGRPTGGPKDLTPPKKISSIPKNKTTNFKGKEIKIYFDEFIKLKKVFENLVVSPPLKHVPTILPSGSASKYIDIKIKDTLQSNTTYIFNFGESIVDITEGNILKDFKFIFSTGNIIDSLKIQGTLKDSYLEETPKKTSIFLYKVNKQFSDSIIYKKKPTYITSTFGKKEWNISNIRAGDYLLIAMQDVSKNLKFNPKEDAIGFKSDIVHLPTKKKYELSLFKEAYPYKLQKPKEISKGHIIIGYEGSKDSVSIELISKVNKEYKALKTFDNDKDTLNYWYKNLKKDSLQFKDVVNKKIFTVKFKKKKQDSLIVKQKTRNVLLFYNDFKLEANLPLVKIDNSKINLIDKDSSKIKFITKISKEKNIISFKFIKKESAQYQIRILPKAIKTFFNTYNKDTLHYKFATKKKSDYGNLFLTLKNVKRFPIIVQILDKKYKVIEQRYLLKNKEVDFENLSPSDYRVRIIYDDNKNKKWDTGIYLKKIQPEKIIYYPKIISLKANWDIIETFTLP